MAKPKVTIQGYTYLFEFDKEQVTMFFDRLHDEGKATKGEIWVSSTAPANKGHIHHTRFDLTSTTQKKALVKQLEERWADASWDWGDLIEQCSISVLGHFRKGEPVIAIQADVTKLAPPEYVIYPILPRLQPTIMFGQGGVGKTQIKGDKVLMSKGEWKNVEDIQVGDCILSPQLDGTSMYAPIINVHSHFADDVYEIREQTRANRLLYTCAGSHEIPIIRHFAPRINKRRGSKRNHETYNYNTRNRERRLYKYTATELGKLRNSKSQFCSFTTTTVTFDQPNSSINPYCLGAFLGDGCYTPKSRGVILTTTEIAIANEFIRTYSADMRKTQNKAGTDAKDYHLSVNGEFARELRRVGLAGKYSGTKFIPKECLLSDIPYRMQLLAGLIDTDGYVDKKNTIIYATKSEELAKNLKNLVFSLGGYCTLLPITKSIKSTGFTGNYYSVTISFKDATIIPLRTWKQNRISKRVIEPRHIAVKAVRTNPQMVYGFEIDSPSKWYITNNWMVTHNSQLAQLLAIHVLTAWHDNPFGLKVGVKEPRPVLYLDWETDDKNIAYTFTKLKNGLSRPDCTLHYRRCAQPFADDLAEIHKMVDQVKPELLIIDSIGAAIQTDLNAADGAIRLLTKDIRQLKVTSLILAHQAKHGDPKSPFGSIFFYNYARSVVECRKHQELGEDRMEVGIFCHKANIAKLFKPIGLEIAFFEDGTIVERKDVMDLPEMESAMPLIDRMYNILKKPMTIATLAETLNVEENEIQGILSNRADRFVRLPNGTWAGKTGKYNYAKEGNY